MTPISNLSLPGAVGVAETVQAGPPGSNGFTTLLSALQPSGPASAEYPAAALPEAVAPIVEGASAVENSYTLEGAAKDVSSRLPPVPQSLETAEAGRAALPGALVEASSLPLDPQEASDGTPFDGDNPRKRETEHRSDEAPAPAPTANWTPIVLPAAAPATAVPAEPAADVSDAPVASLATRVTQSALLGSVRPEGAKQPGRHTPTLSAGSEQGKQPDLIPSSGLSDASGALGALEDLTRVTGLAGTAQHVPAARTHAGPQLQSPVLDSSQAGIGDAGLSQLDALVRDIAELSGSSGRAAFRVSARELGDVHVQLRTTDAGLSVNIRTQTEHSHSAVAQAQGQLAEDMRANGLKVAATSVAVGHDGAQRGGGERHPVPRHVPVETAPASELDEPVNEQRRDGRYA